MNETLPYRNGRQKSGNRQPEGVRIPSLSCGLTAEEADRSRRLYGSNAVTPHRQAGFFRRFLGNLNDPIIKILIAALVVNIAFSFNQSGWIESAGIAVTVLISALVTTVSEHSSGASFARLYASLGDSICHVLRDGADADCPVSALVRYDLVCLHPGDTVPADGIILRGQVSCDESALTGESRAVTKTPDPAATLTGDAADLKAGAPNAVFKGSHVLSGDATMLVLAVGDATMYGSIATELSADDGASPLKQRLEKLARAISKIGYCSAAVVAAVHLADAFWFEAGCSPALALARLSDLRFVFSEVIQALTLAISVIVVAVPEGLPLMTAVVMSSNMKRMLKAGVLVRRLVGIETSGSIDLLFTDKTGTLTTGKLSVTGIRTADGSFSSKKGCPTAVLRHLKTSGIACSGGHNQTERALNGFIGLTSVSGAADDGIPFDSSRKFAAGVIGDRLYIRGAPEMLLPACRSYLSHDGAVLPMTDSVRHALLDALDGYTADSCRVILHAEGDGSLITPLKNRMPDADTPLVFCAFSVIRDEVRPEVIPSVKACRDAGIQVVMITGDNAETAAGVAEVCGILDPGSRMLGRDPDDGISALLVDGRMLSSMTDEQVTAILPRLRVVSRVTPADKSRLVRLAAAAGHITGMTGDGVNDAPALKAADVGFAMGSGTDIAREAGDIVITDDNFVSITKAVLFGRTIFSSIRKFITFQLTMNLAAVGVCVIGTMFGIENPVTVIQMLWVNIIMDTLGSLAFAGEPALDEYMRQPPVSRGESILNRPMVAEIALTGVYAVLLSLWFLLSPSIRHLTGGGISHLTAFFALFIFMGIGIALCTRTPRINLFAGIGKNRAFLLIMPAVAFIQLLMVYFGGEVFRCVPLPSNVLGFTALLAFSVLPADAIRKALVGLRANRKAK